uniref:Uncharacterized protein n=1 Tax=Populus trichocarpa TaxID=3694 RepID=A9PB28_POPTR|nr:unknown [Populus trichocarpa]
MDHLKLSPHACELDILSHYCTCSNLCGTNRNIISTIYLQKPSICFLKKKKLLVSSGICTRI